MVIGRPGWRADVTSRHGPLGNTLPFNFPGQDLGTGTNVSYRAVFSFLETLVAVSEKEVQLVVLI